MIPLFGIGFLPAVIALTIYGLLPILRNTYTGIISVDQAAIESGKGMGMTQRQVLFMVEIPLALPIIMAGIRTATVLIIGVATIATLIGSGGLGDLIYRGIAMASNDLILAGAIPAAILALVFDFGLKKIEDWVTPKGSNLIDQKNQIAVGLEINANHIRGKRDGIVTAVAVPLHKGRTTMVWDIKITDEEGKLVCVFRCTMAIVDRKPTN